MRRLLIAFVLAISSVATVAQARGLELSLNDDMAQFLFSSGAEPLGIRDAELSFGVLFNEDDDVLGLLRMMATNRVSPSLKLGVGLQGYFGHLDQPDETMGGIAIGGNVGVGLASQIPLALVVEGWVAPRILSFSDADKIREWSARIEAQVSSNAAFFVGYRQLKIKLTEHRGNHKVDGSAQIGVRIGF